MAFIKLFWIMNKSFLRDFQGQKVQDWDQTLLWLISWLLFDRDYETVVWCIYKKWFLQYGYFLFDNIKEKKENIFIVSKRNLSEEFYEIYGKIVKNQQWEMLGYVWDIDFNIVNKLQYIYIDRGYDFSLNVKHLVERKIIKISKKAIISYEDEYILINDKESLKENKKTLENIRKVFINIPNPTYTINLKKYE